MRTAIISDIHANLDALKVVLDDLRAQNADRVVCLGDVVGYGPEPNECVQLVKETCAFTVVGNHDYAALGRLDTLAFNDYARAAADWTSEALSPESREFLEQLPLTKELDGMLLVHASPHAPEEWTYVLSYHEAERQFAAFTERLCFIGHSHLPVVVENAEGHVEALRYPNGDPLPAAGGVPLHHQRGQRRAAARPRSAQRVRGVRLRGGHRAAAAAGVSGA